MGKVLGVLFLVVVAIVGVGYWQLGAIVKRAIEEVGTRMAGVPVTVDRVLLSPLSGNGSISGLRVANPPGFVGKNAFAVGSAAVKINVKSLLGEKVVIHQIHFSDIALEYEGRGEANNLTKLQQNVDRNTRALRSRAGASESSASSGTEQASGKSAPEKKRSYLIEDLWIQGVKVSARKVFPSGLSLMGDKPLEIAIPDIRLKNVSNNSSAEVTQELTRQVMAAVTAGVMKNFSTSVNDAAKQLLEKAGKGEVKEMLQKGLKALPGGLPKF